MNLDVLFNAAAKPKDTAPESITIRRPDDWHIHLRDGAMLQAVLPFTAGQFARGIVMPNLVPPVTTVAAAEAYRSRILAALPAASDFQPLMTCYLTDDTSADEIETGHTKGAWIAAKLYPAGATTNSHFGVRDLKAIRTVLERMERIGKEHQGLKVVIEHVTTEETAAIVRAHAPRVAGTITPHHLMINRTSLFQGGLRPHFYCLPVAKREHHRIALRRAATSGDSCFFIGTDTAPHLAHLKEASCGCAGVFVGATALQTYAQVFDEEGALDRLERFASLNGAKFYGLAPNSGTIELHRRPAAVLAAVAVGDDEVVVFRGDENLPWSLGEVRP
jgi:dihydroorotase